MSIAAPSRLFLGSLPALIFHRLANDDDKLADCALERQDPTQREPPPKKPAA
jgi:hypothetical protein